MCFLLAEDKFCVISKLSRPLSLRYQSCHLISITSSIYSTRGLEIHLSIVLQIQNEELFCPYVFVACHSSGQIKIHIGSFIPIQGGVHSLYTVQLGNGFHIKYDHYECVRSIKRSFQRGNCEHIHHHTIFTISDLRVMKKNMIVYTSQFNQLYPAFPANNPPIYQNFTTSSKIELVCIKYSQKLITCRYLI